MRLCLVIIGALRHLLIGLAVLGFTRPWLESSTMSTLTLKLDAVMASSVVATLGGHLTNFGKLVAQCLREASKFKAPENKQQATASLLIAILGFHLYYWHKYSHWSRRNVRGPRPLPVLGNLLSFFRRPRQELELEWPKKYGKIYGYYMGTKPYLVCADAQVMKQICVRDFDKFPNHMFVGVRNKYQKHFIVFQEDDHWRGMRQILTPTFSSGKIKVLSRILERCADDLASSCQLKVEEGLGEATIDVREMMAPHSIGCALRSFFGVEPKSKDSGSKFTEEEFAKQSRAAVEQSYFRFIMSSILPLRLMEILNLPLIRDKQMQFFADTAKSIIARRQLAPPGQYKDYLQLLLEAKLGNEVEVAESDGHERHHAQDISENTSNTGLAPTKMRLTEMEMFCQTMMLMMVATETTATLLSHTVYLLAHHQEIQDKLYNELMELERRQGELDYEQLTSCQYLDCVISESLRLMTPALFFDRVAAEDYYIEEYGIQVPKGTVVNLAYYAIHRDPDYWSEPDKFDPDRFLPENKDKIVSGSYSPFGIGPRACIGFRFALTEAKTAIAKLLSKFHFDKAPGTVYPPEPVKATLVLNLNKNMLVNFTRRHRHQEL